MISLSLVLYTFLMNTKSKGHLSESIVCDTLVSQGFEVIERNYLRKWGEIDIVARKDGELHFVEVKSDFRGRGSDGYRPEEQVHDLKRGRLRRTIATYLVERKYGLDHPFIFDVIVISFGKGRAGEQYSIRTHENIII